MICCSPCAAATLARGFDSAFPAFRYCLTASSTEPCKLLGPAGWSLGLRWGGTASPTRQHSTSHQRHLGGPAWPSRISLSLSTIRLLAEPLVRLPALGVPSDRKRNPEPSTPWWLTRPWLSLLLRPGLAGRPAGELRGSSPLLQHGRGERPAERRRQQQAPLRRQRPPHPRARRCR